MDVSHLPRLGVRFCERAASLRAFAGAGRFRYISAGTLVAVAIVLFAMSSAVAVGTADADSETIYIDDWNELDKIGDDPDYPLDANYVLVRDLEVGSNEVPSGSETSSGYLSAVGNKNEGFEPIGTAGTPFTGTFDGNGHEIRGLRIERGSTTSVGLFGATDDATIKDVTVKTFDGNFGFQVSGTGTTGEGTGLLVGTVKGSTTIEDVTVEGDVNEGDTGRNFGGVAGVVTGNDATIQRVEVDVAVSAASSRNVGGVVGKNTGTVREASNLGGVDGGDVTGGIVGENTGTVREASNLGAVTGGDITGGIVGRNTGTVQDASNFGAVDGGDVTGGIVGENTGTIETSSSSGAVTGADTVGGAVGANDGTVQNVYSLGDVDGSDFVGGLVGNQSSSTAVLDLSYSAGDVSGTSSNGYVAGSIGFDQASTLGDDIYYNQDASIANSGGGSVQGTGIGNAQFYSTTSLAQSDMKGSAASSNMGGFDFSSTWKTIDESGTAVEGKGVFTDGYPILAGVNQSRQVENGQGLTRYDPPTVEVREVSTTTDSETGTVVAVEVTDIPASDSPNKGNTADLSFDVEGTTEITEQNVSPGDGKLLFNISDRDPGPIFWEVFADDGAVEGSTSRQVALLGEGIGGSYWNTPSRLDEELTIESGGLQLETGEFPQRDWLERPGRNIRYLAVGQDGNVYGADQRDRVFKVDPEGNRLWREGIHDDRIRGLSVGPNGDVYTVGDDKTVYKVNSTNGAEVWNYSADVNTRFMGVAVADDGTVYAGDDAGKVYEIESDGSSASVFYSGIDRDIRALEIGSDGNLYAFGFSNNGERLVDRINENGDQVWRAEAGARNIAQGPAGNIYVTDRGENVVRKLDKEDGSQVWVYNENGDEHDNEPWNLAVGPVGDVYVSFRYDGGNARQFGEVHKIDSVTGEQEWRYTGHADDVWSVAVADDGHVYAGDGDRFLHKVDQTLKSGHKPGREVLQTSIESPSGEDVSWQSMQVRSERNRGNIWIEVEVDGVTQRWFRPNGGLDTFDFNDEVVAQSDDQVNVTVLMERNQRGQFVGSPILHGITFDTGSEATLGNLSVAAARTGTTTSVTGDLSVEPSGEPGNRPVDINLSGVGALGRTTTELDGFTVGAGKSNQISYNTGDDALSEVTVDVGTLAGPATLEVTGGGDSETFSLRSGEQTFDIGLADTDSYTLFFRADGDDRTKPPLVVDSVELNTTEFTTTGDGSIDSTITVPEDAGRYDVTVETTSTDTRTISETSELAATGLAVEARLVDADYVDRPLFGPGEDYYLEVMVFDSDGQELRPTTGEFSLNSSSKSLDPVEGKVNTYRAGPFTAQQGSELGLTFEDEVVGPNGEASFNVSYDVGTLDVTADHLDLVAPGETFTIDGTVTRDADGAAVDSGYALAVAGDQLAAGETLRIDSTDDWQQVISDPGFEITGDGTLKKTVSLDESFEDGTLSGWDVSAADEDFFVTESVSGGDPVDGQYAVQIENDPSSRPIADYELSSAGQPETFDVRFYETGSNQNGGIQLLDSSDDVVVGVGTDNPQWRLQDSDGDANYGGQGGSYRSWHNVTVDFNWTAGTYKATFKDPKGGTFSTDSRNLGGATDIKTVRIPNNNNFPGGNDNRQMWFDSIQLDPSGSTSVSRDLGRQRYLDVLEIETTMGDNAVVTFGYEGEQRHLDNGTNKIHLDDVDDELAFNLTVSGDASFDSVELTHYNRSDGTFSNATDAPSEARTQAYDIDAGAVLGGERYWGNSSFNVNDDIRLSLERQPAANADTKVTVVVPGRTSEYGTQRAEKAITAAHGTFTLDDQTVDAEQSIATLEFTWSVGDEPAGVGGEVNFTDPDTGRSGTRPYTIQAVATLAVQTTGGQDTVTAPGITSLDGADDTVELIFNTDPGAPSAAEDITVSASPGIGENVSAETVDITESIAPGDSGSTTTTVSVDAGAPPDEVVDLTRRLDFTADFTMDGVGGASTGARLDVVVEPNPIMNVPTKDFTKAENRKRFADPGTSEKYEFTVGSEGNAELSTLDAEITQNFDPDPTVPPWIEFEGAPTTVPAGDDTAVVANVSIPEDAPAGEHNATIEFQADNEFTEGTQTVTKNITMEVNPTRGLDIKVADDSVTAAVNTETQVTNLEVANTGNVPWKSPKPVEVTAETAAGTSYADSLSVGDFEEPLADGQNQTVSVTADVPDETGTHDLTVKYFVEDDAGVESSATDTFTLEGVPFEVSNGTVVGGTPVDGRINETAPVPLDIQFDESGVPPDALAFDVALSYSDDQLDSLSNGQTFPVQPEVSGSGTAYTLDVPIDPSIPDARLYDVEVTVTHTPSGATRSLTLEEWITVPDETSPEVNDVSATGITKEPGSQEVDGESDITIKVADNELDSDVQSVTFDVRKPDGGILKGLGDVEAELDESSFNTQSFTRNTTWTATVDVGDVASADYTIDATATDPANNVDTGTGQLRVAKNVQLSGVITNSTGDPQNATIRFKDSEGNIIRDENGDPLVDKAKDGKYDVTALEGNYTMEVEYENYEVSLRNASITEEARNKQDMIKLDNVEPNAAPAPGEAQDIVQSLGAEMNMSFTGATVTFDYSDDELLTSRARVAYCDDYDFDDLRCNGGLQSVPTTINRVDETVTIDVESFSAYTLYEASPVAAGNLGTGGGGGGGGGGGSGSSLGVAEERALEELSKLNVSSFQVLEELNSTVDDFGRLDTLLDNVENLNRSQGSLNGTSEDLEEIKDEVTDPSQAVTTDRSRINEELIRGERIRTTIGVRNELTETQEYRLTTEGDVAEFIDVQDTLTVEPDQLEDVLVRVSIPEDAEPGLYSGLLNIESDSVQTEVPVNIRVREAEGRTLDVSVNPTSPSVEPGGDARAEVTVIPDGFTGPVETTVRMDLVHSDSEEVVASTTEELTVDNRHKQGMAVTVPEDARLGAYQLRVQAEGTRDGETYEGTSLAGVSADLPILQQSAFGLTHLQWLLVGFGLVLALLAAYALYAYRRKQKLAQQRYTDEIDLEEMPSGGARQAYLGTLADRDAKAYMKLDDLTTHALIAGATGSGKSVTGQIMVEEALNEGVNVIVIDPTAQWSGFLSECEDEGMFEHYPTFDLSREDAQGFDGNIRAVEPGGEIDIQPYLENDRDGDIYVFGLHKLDNKNIDEFLSNTIRQVFEANLTEKDQLETLIVYDEAHRVLEQFGGSGEGVTQLERAVREFRKWGVGMVLLSQVVSDFSGEIRANIGTTVQMRTQYDGDLERLEAKYGTDTIKSIAKAEVGSGMFQNSEYNHGRPYFVDYRPLLHSPYRLSDEELDKFEDFNRRILNLEDVISGMPEDDAYEYRTELKLVKKNLQKGSFNLVEIYLEELEEDLMTEHIKQQNPAEDDD